MKQIFNFSAKILWILILSMAISGCVKDDENSPSNNISDLYGTWVMVKAQGNGINLTFSVSDEVDKVTFYRDGTAYTYVYDATATWSYTNDILKMTASDGSITNGYVKTLNSSTWVIEINNIACTYRKI